MATNSQCLVFNRFLWLVMMCGVSTAYQFTEYRNYHSPPPYYGFWDSQEVKLLEEGSVRPKVKRDVKDEGNKHTNNTFGGGSFYNFTIMSEEDLDADDSYWVDMSSQADVTQMEKLTNAHRKAVTVKLPFEFPFFGHLIKNVTVATGGFLYTGDFVHSWISATQYIAPLMANFETKDSNESSIRSIGNGTAFTVEWANISLLDNPTAGRFTFQTTLHKNGDIVFVYKEIPIPIGDISDKSHPTKVGLSDAYILERLTCHTKKKTIYEYQRVTPLNDTIQNGTVIYLRAFPTCLSNKDCTTCLNSKVPSSPCMWCPQVSRCSNGMDRKRQDWFANSCDTQNTSDVATCPVDDVIPSPDYNDDKKNPADKGTNTDVPST